MDLKQLYHSVEEHPDFVEVQITGSIPTWLQGSYYKVGNGKFDLPGGFTFNHAFDGYAIICHYDISDNKVKYRSRYLDSDAYTKAMETGKPLYTEFGTRSYPDPNKTIFARVFASLVPGDLTDNNCVNIFKFRGNLFVASETCFIRQINRETLSSVCKADFHKSLGVNLATSHCLEDQDGTSYNIATSFITGLKYHVVKFSPLPAIQDASADPDPLKGGEIIATINSSWKTCFSYTHSFGMSEKFVIMIEQPLLANSLKLLASQVQGKALKDCLGWEPTEKTRFYLIEKSSGKVLTTRYLGPPFFFYHVINAYDEDGHVICDVIAHPSSDVIEKFSLSKLRNSEFDQSNPQSVHRYVFPVTEHIKDMTPGGNLVKLRGTTAKAEVHDDAIVCTPETIGEPGVELPCINPKLCGRKYRYAYGTGLYTDGHFKNAIGKLDFETKETKIWQATESQCLSEPCFIPNPSGTDEDDGVVISTILGTQNDHSHILLVVDAKSFHELGRAEIPHKSSVGNHSLFMPS